MKKRVKVDSTILSSIIIMTGFLFAFQDLYPRNPFLDDALDFLGFIVLLTGIILRMSARGHKKTHSQKSEKLVTSGPYTFVRNPMYFGSFLMGAGFILMVWPWWSLPVFAVLFYMRFTKQIIKEEAYLLKMGGDSYTRYCKRVQRIFPSMRHLSRARLRRVIKLKEVFSTNEKRGLWCWPILAFILESFQEWLIFEETIPSQTLKIFIMAAVVFVIGFWILYQKK